MFGKKKPIPQIDKEQLELIENAQRRIKQKKRLYVHFVIFLIGALFLILANTVLGIGEDFKIFEINWFVFAIFFWLFFFLYHVFNVFITHKFMGKAWEKQQLEKLVAKQQVRIEKLKAGFVKEETLIAQSEVYKDSTTKIENLKSNAKKAELTIIVAAAENDAIGKGNKLIWHLSDDLKRFKSLTNGHHIIMGRKTFESFPKPLPNRTHVVISRQANYKVPEGVILVHSLDEAIDASKNDLQPFIIGGGEIYKQAMNLAVKIELTRVHENFDADTYFPKIDTAIWKETANVFHKKDENHDYEFSFLTYERK
jgi:dihydrofolate reductase